MIITPKTLITDILKHTPGSAKVFKRYNMACTSCMGVVNETLEKACHMHGIDMKALTDELQASSK